MTAGLVPALRSHRTPVVRELTILLLLASSAIIALVVVPERQLTVGTLALVLFPLALLPARHAAPLWVFAGVEAAAVAARLAFGPNGPTDLMVLVALFAVASRRGPRLAALTVGLDVTGLLVAATLVPAEAWPAVTGEVIGQVVLDVAVVLLALYLAVRRDHLLEVEDRADRLARLQQLEASVAVEAERRRMARELHDVVAHHVSVMTLHAGAVQRRLRDLPDVDDLLEATTELRGTGHEAMQELRRMLDVLRADGSGDARAPQPGLADLDALVERVREAGLPIRFTAAGDLDRPPSGVQAVAYRIIQEALTNTLRHAGTVPTDVTVRATNRHLHLVVHDHPPSRTRPLPPGGERSREDPGHGITGMRERAELYGGHVQAGPAADGGWRVAADLPTPTVATDRAGTADRR